MWVNSADDVGALLVHPAVGPPGRSGDRRRVDRRAQPGAGVVAARPAGRAAPVPALGELADLLGRARRRLHDAGPEHRERWTGPPCSTARCPPWSGPGGSTRPAPSSRRRPASLRAVDADATPRPLAARSGLGHHEDRADHEQDEGHGGRQHHGRGVAAHRLLAAGVARRELASETWSRRSAGHSTPSASRTTTTKMASPPMTQPSPQPVGAVAQAEEQRTRRPGCRRGCGRPSSPRAGSSARTVSGSGVAGAEQRGGGGPRWPRWPPRWPGRPPRSRRGGGARCRRPGRPAGGARRTSSPIGRGPGCPPARSCSRERVAEPVP